METIQVSSLLNIVDYEKIRDQYRKDIIDYKKNRRVFLGPQISMVFENLKTIKFQIQEMMRAERMIRDQEIEQEIDIYKTLLPSPNELSATLFIEITEEGRIRQDLHQFIGMTDNQSLVLVIGSVQVVAVFEPGRSEEDKISSVHYIRFPFSPDQLNLFRNTSIPAFFRISHKSYVHEFAIPSAMRTSLIEDLTT